MSGPGGDSVSTARADELIDLLCDPGTDMEVRGAAANELLGEFYTGCPVDGVRRLVRSPHLAPVRSGVWLLAELAALAAPLLDEIATLLDHPHRNVRFHAVDAVVTATTGATHADGAVIAKAVRLVADPDEVVREKVILCLAQVTTDQLTAAIRHLGAPLAVLTTWLAAEGNDPANAPDVSGRLQDPDKMARMFAAAAACRIATTTSGPLQSAASSPDREIRAFAEFELKMLPGRIEQQLRGRRSR